MTCHLIFPGFGIQRLLETLYKAFDEIAAKRRVFKVETVGGECVLLHGIVTRFLSLSFAHT